VKPAALDDVTPTASRDDLAAAQRLVDAVTVSESVLDYVAAIVRRTRELPSVALGASPRAGVHLLAAARAIAALTGRSFVVPEDVQAAVPTVLRHRLLLRPEAELEQYSTDDALRAAVASVPVPR
jgi:MoxR-like ATPase